MVQKFLQLLTLAGALLDHRKHGLPYLPPQFPQQQGVDYANMTKTQTESELVGHGCIRDCWDSEPPMECYYKFNVEHYYTMSKACFDCPRTISDCFRPDCIPADGVKRPLTVVNRQMPGPAIEVCEGDRVIVDVVNKLRGEGTTIHWHGLHMKNNPYMDGTPWVSQCPITAGSTFRYSFIAENAGTHFWHSHVGFQRGDGLYGPLIVRPRMRCSPERNSSCSIYDHDEHILVISDWDHKMSLDKFLGHYHAGSNNSPDNILVNGLGRDKDKVERNEKIPLIPLATFNVEENLRYRFRIINAGSLNCPIELSVDNHTLIIVSSDGNDLQPLAVQSIVTYAGERFDIVIKMDQKPDNYWLRFRGLVNCGPTLTKAHQVAILHYVGSPDKEPEADVAYEIPSDADKFSQINPLNKGTEDLTIVSVASLRALDDNDEANTKEPDYQFYIAFDFYGKDNEEFHRDNLYGYGEVPGNLTVETPQLNHISMKMQSFPLMSQTEQIKPSMFCNAMTIKKNCMDELCSCTHVIQAELGSVVELILVDEGVPYNASHPFHLHGHEFRVLAMKRLGKNVTITRVIDDDREGLIERNFENPPIKDTVTVPDGGYTILRFHANNPGYWLFHCHIEFHAEVGMALVFKVGEHREFAPVPKGFPRCGDYQPLFV